MYFTIIFLHLTPSPLDRLSYHYSILPFSLKYKGVPFWCQPLHLTPSPFDRLSYHYSILPFSLEYKGVPFWCQPLHLTPSPFDRLSFYSFFTKIMLLLKLFYDIFTLYL